MWSICGRVLHDNETRARTAALIEGRKSMKPWGYIAIAVATIGILMNLKDIQRYIRISTM
jgi:hypothetical protein